jgi:hypothetical protein
MWYMQSMKRWAPVVLIVLLGLLGWRHHAGRADVSVTAAQAARYPALNPPGSDTWMVPVNGTHGVGRYVNPVVGWWINVQTGFIGTMTGDDACGAMRATGSLYSYVADFSLRIRNGGSGRMSLHAPAFTLDGNGTHHGTWGVGYGVHLRPGGTANRLLVFYDLPRGSAVYGLDVALPDGQTARIGTYAVAPNGRKPDCP